MVVVGRWSVGRVGPSVTSRVGRLLSELWSRPIDWSRFDSFIPPAAVSAIDIRSKIEPVTFRPTLGYYGCEELGSE